MNSMHAFIAAIVIIGIAAGCFYYFEWDPVVNDQRPRLESEVNTLLSQSSDLDRLPGEIAEAEKKKKEIEAKIEEMKTDIPKLDKIVPQMLESTETASNIFNIKFQDIRISPLVRADKWSELPVEMTILGTYTNVVAFLSVMEQRKLINLAAGSINIAVSSEIDKDSKDPMLSVNLSAKVFLIE